MKFHKIDNVVDISDYDQHDIELGSDRVSAHASKYIYDIFPLRTLLCGEHGKWHWKTSVFFYKYYSNSELYVNEISLIFALITVSAVEQSASKDDFAFLSEH